MDPITNSLAGAAAVPPPSAAAPSTQNNPGQSPGDARKVEKGSESQPMRLEPSTLPSRDETRDAFGLTAEERRVVEEMKARHDEVVRHEQAHAQVGGEHAGNPTYDYQQGPDGRRYAVSGQVKIDTSPEDEPEATIDKMEVVKRAALAPAEPSPQDRKVAQTADRIRNQAQAELIAQRAEERRERLEGPQDSDRAAEADRQRAEASDAVQNAIAGLV